MSDFNDLVDDAENFEVEENVDDYYPAEFSIAANSNKRANNDDYSQPNNKKAKQVAHLADYFSDTVESRHEKESKFEEKRMNSSETSHSQNNYGVSQSTDEKNSNQPKGPNCLCGIISVSKTTLKEGPNKNRMFWICSHPRENQCKFFEWCDETKPEFSGSASQTNQGADSKQKAQPSSQGGPPCKCNLSSIQRTTMKEGPNQGRNFWVCPQSRDAQCKFFEWENVEPSNQVSSSSNKSNDVYNNRSNDTSSSNGNSGGMNKGSCYKCGKEGHWSSTCPNTQGKGGGGGGGGGSGGYNKNGSNNYNNYGSNTSASSGGSDGQKSGSCYKCGEAGHWSTNCPKAGGGSRYKRN